MFSASVSEFADKEFRCCRNEAIDCRLSSGSVGAEFVQVNGVSVFSGTEGSEPEKEPNSLTSTGRMDCDSCFERWTLEALDERPDLRADRADFGRKSRGT